MRQSYAVIGLMSGTSLDGVDLAFCKFEYGSKWTFTIHKAKTIPYTKEWNSKLKNLHLKSAIELARTNIEYGSYLGTIVKDFISRNHLSVDFIASHGHTIFHQPQNKLTLQIGDGNSIAAQTALPVIYDFRSKDVSLGGQGAPLVPIGDKLLFNDYDYCINLGGIANISFDQHGKRIAFDICPANQILNFLSNELGKPFDDKGKIASRGIVNTTLLSTLNSLGFYSDPTPKSLGREWVEEAILPILDHREIKTEDKLRTFTEHIAIQITTIINQKPGKTLVTGGGAHNDFLIERIQSLTQSQIVIPSLKLIDYKEAMIFAFLGTLRMRNEINCLSSVTGASRDSSSGIIIR